MDRDYRGSGCAVGDGMPCFCCAQSIPAAGTVAAGQAGTEKADGEAGKSGRTAAGRTESPRGGAAVFSHPFPDRPDPDGGEYHCFSLDGQDYGQISPSGTGWRCHQPSGRRTESAAAGQGLCDHAGSGSGTEPEWGDSPSDSSGRDLPRIPESGWDGRVRQYGPGFSHPSGGSAEPAETGTGTGTAESSPFPESADEPGACQGSLCHRCGTAGGKNE